MKEMTNLAMQDALGQLSKMISCMMGDSEKFKKVPELLDEFWKDYPQLNPCHLSKEKDKTCEGRLT